MNLIKIADVGQVLSLIGFAACLVYALYIGRRWAQTRLWLLPVIFYVTNGSLFYTATVLNLFSVPARTTWSVALRLNGLALLLFGLATTCWMLRERDKRS